MLFGKFAKISTFFIIAIFSLAFISSLSFFLSSSNTQKSYYYLAHWEWHQDDDLSYWSAPYVKENMGLIDFRSIPQQIEQKGNDPKGYGFFAYPRKVNIKGAIYLGDDLDKPLQNRDKFVKALNVSDLKSVTIADVLWELLNYKADPTGQERWRPLTPSTNGEIQLHLAGHPLLKKEKFDPKKHTLAMTVIRNDVADLYYKFQKEKGKQKDEDETIWKKYLGWLENKYNMSYKNFLADGVKDLGKLTPATTLTDDFNRADQSLDATGVWTEVSGNWSIASNAVHITLNQNSTARYETNLSGSDNYSQITISTFPDFKSAGVAVRFDSSSNTAYVFSIDSDNTGREWFKVISGTYTALNTSSAGDFQRAVPFNVYAEARGTTLNATVDGVDIADVTDSSITTGLRVGMFAQDSTVTIDAFEGGDFNSAPTISSVSDSPDPVISGNDVAFSVDWNDADAGDQVKAHICKTDAITTQTCDGGSWADSGSFTTTDPIELTYTATDSDSGANNYYVFVCDDDNSCSSSTSGSFTVNIDSTSPSISLTALSPDPNTDTTPTLTGTATEAVGTVSSVQFQMDSTSGSWSNCTADDGTFDEASEDFSCTVSSALSSGSHTMYVRATDSNGNTTGSGNYSSDTFTIDGTAPTGSITINSGASTTTSSDVTLTLSASDDVDSSGSLQMKISEDSGFSGASYEAFSTSKSWTLSDGDGTKTVYAKFKDTAGNESSTYSNSITLDSEGPAAINLESPGNNSYTSNERQTFKWKATTDSSGLSKYVLQIDNPSIGSDQPSGDFTIDGIPTSGTEDYETSKYIAHYENFSDDDSSNDYISVYTKSSSDWGDSENDGKLREGNVTWRVKAVDSSGNETTSSRNLFVDRSSPSVSITQINDVSYSGNSFATTDTTPSIYGRLIDPLRGGDSSETQNVSGPGVASGPKQVDVKIEKKDGLGYTLISLYTINLNEQYFTCDDTEISNNSEQSCDKYSPFEYTSNEALSIGEYRITLIGKDNADNSSSENQFTLNITTLSQITTPEEKNIIEEEVNKLPQKEQEKVKKELEITKPTATPKPNILEKTGSGAAQVSKTVVGTVSKLISTVFNGAANGVSMAFHSIGSGYNSLAQNSPKFAKGTLMAIGKGVGNTVKTTKKGIANIVFAIGVKTEDVSHGVGIAIVQFGYLFVSEPTRITNVKQVILSSTSVKISWDTNHPANGKVNYGFADGDYQFDKQTDKKTNHHEFILTGLKPGTQYDYEVMSQNRNYVYDANRKFKTPAK